MIDLNDIATRIKRTSALVVDTETTGLDWRVDKPIGYVLTFSEKPEDSFYLPTDHTGGDNLDRGRVLAMLRTELQARPNLHTVGFYLGFDMMFAHKDGIKFPGPLEDAWINATLIDERQYDWSLEGCCKYMSTTPKKGDALYKHMASKFGGEPTRKAQMQHFHELPGDDPLAVDYATGDGTATWDLWEQQQSSLDNQDLRRVWGVECRVIRVLHRMSLRGVRVDEERVEQVKRMVGAQLERARSKLPPDFNDRASTQVEKLLRDAGITDWPMTAPTKKFPNGQPSFVEAWLQSNEPGRRVIAVRKLRNLLNSFLEPLIENHLHNGRVHTDFNQARGDDYGTITGRLSSSNPNLQQIPKRNKELGPIFRSIFVPDPGYVWKSADYQQCEPRLLAHFGEVKVLLDGYRADPPMDAHSSVALAAGIDREPGKRMNQALLTGAGVGRLRELLVEYGAEPSRANQMVANYFASMPEIKPFQKRAEGIMRARGYVRSILGRRARLDDVRFAYRAVNRILQMGNADINKKALADVDEWYAQNGDYLQLLNDVHDDLCQQQPIGDPRGDVIFAEAIRRMEDYGPGRSIELSIPMVMDVGTGNSWAEATYGRETVKKVFETWGEKYE